ncbi:MAG: HhoA/HhoB/HtrA family serine endopeptidase [Synechococcales cyanobacterium]
MGTSLLFGSGVAGGVWLTRSGYGEQWLPSWPQATVAQPPTQDAASSGLTALQQVSRDPVTTNFITDVASQVGPSVVRITTTRPTTRRLTREAPAGTGSGFIISADGVIITNAHVVEGSAEVTVTLKDGRSFPGVVKGTDPVTDVAVIKVDAQDLPTVALGDSDLVRPGDWAVAIGNPLGLDSTITAGIISAIGRSSTDVGVPDKRVSFLQTDAAINPGNSGGPLLDAQGRVIGVNTAIIRGAQGLGFSIPINTARRIAEQLLQNGEVQHAYLGIQMVTLTPTLREEINAEGSNQITVDQGVVIAGVQPGSPAAQAGLRVGDVITAIGTRSITEAAQVQEQVAAVAVGDPLDLSIHRQGREQPITVRTGSLTANR